MDAASTLEFVTQLVDAEIIPLLSEYVKVPSLSPAYDAEWETNGLMETAMNLLLDWVKAQAIEGLTLDIHREPTIPPIVLIEIPATGENLPSTLIYGHMDKQPHFTGWLEGLGPTTPVVRGDLLYGRGAADDGYAIPGAILAIQAVKRQGLPHGRIVIVAENEEESGSPHLGYLVNKLKPRIGEPDVIICLDSGCGNYEQLWITNSLRGVVGFELNVRVLDEGVHSGYASGIVPSSVRVIRQLLDRLEDPRTGRVLVESMHKPLTPKNYADAASVATTLGDVLLSGYKFAGSTKPMHTDAVELILNRTLRPTLSYTGAKYLPACEVAGNVLRPETSFSLSFRIPAEVNEEAIQAELHQKLLNDVPSGATVEIRNYGVGSGFIAPVLQPWLEQKVQKASQAFWGKEALYFGEGGSIPFMKLLQNEFPKAQFIVIGLLGPGSNAHSSNESLHIPFLKRLISSVAYILGSPN
jgi:acetylornithine deacetylase/succinyl-diaminopimelate desuccinylase-like protein